MILTAEQIAELRRIIEDYHTAFAINTYGPQVVPPGVVARLQELGLIDYTVNQAQEAYVYGKLLQQLGTPQAAQMSYPQFQRYLKANPIPLSVVEKQAVQIAASRGAQFVVGLGNRIAQDTGQLMVEADADLRQKLQNDIKTATAQGIEQRKSIRQIQSDMGHATEDWTRDLDRIAATETSRALNDGVAAQIQTTTGGDTEVAVLSRQACCEECGAAYNGPDGAPYIFLLKNLQANGTNYKKPKAERQPVVPPFHPNCACSLIEVPEGWGFNENTQLVPDGSRGVRPHLMGKSHGTQGALVDGFDWWGLRIDDARPTRVPGLRQGTVHVASHTYPVFLGPTVYASEAYVMHGPHQDVIVLGFTNVEAAATAMAAHGLSEHRLARGWSAVPIWRLAEQSGLDESRIILPEPSEQPLQKTNSAKARALPTFAPKKLPRRTAEQKDGHDPFLIFTEPNKNDAQDGNQNRPGKPKPKPKFPIPTRTPVRRLATGCRDESLL